MGVDQAAGTGKISLSISKKAQVLMTITCPYCNSGRDIGAVSIPAGGATAKCHACHRQFEVHPEHKAAATTLLIENCPVCGCGVENRDDAEMCSQCGLVFSKYLARISQHSVQPDPSHSGVSDPAAPKSLLLRMLSSTFAWGIAIVVVLAAWGTFGHDRKLDKNYRLQPGN